MYWFGNWIGNIAIAVAAVGYLAELIPVINDPISSVVATCGLIWLLTVVNILGPRVVGALEAWTMLLAIIPILGIALFGWLWFDRDTFMAGWNVSGNSDASAISRAASMALWAYMGVESATVSAGVIENPKRNVPLATLMGLSAAAVIYVLSSTVIMGMLPNEELRTAHAPFAEAARIAIGNWGAVIIAVCAVLKSVGSLGGWMLLVGQSGKAAADDGMFPQIFARINRHGVPGAGLIIVSALMSLVLFATMSPTLAQQFNRIVDLAVILIIVPYVYASVATLKVLHDHGASHRTFVLYKCIALVAVAYCLFAVVGGDPRTVVHALVALLISVPLYPFFMRSHGAGARSQTRDETRCECQTCLKGVPLCTPLLLEARSPRQFCLHSQRSRLSRKTKRRRPRRLVCRRAWTGRSTWTRRSALLDLATRCIAIRGPIRRATSATTGPRER